MANAKEAQARIKINKLLESAGWRFFDDGKGNGDRPLQRYEANRPDEACRIAAEQGAQFGVSGQHLGRPRLVPRGIGGQLESPAFGIVAVHWLIPLKIPDLYHPGAFEQAGAARHSA